MEKSSKTIFSFSAGPSVLPKEVLKQAQEELIDWHGLFILAFCIFFIKETFFSGCGVSVLEMSHRSKEYESIIKKAEQDLRDLLNVPKNYKILFMQGGGTLQFACVPMNLLRGNIHLKYYFKTHIY